MVIRYHRCSASLGPFSDPFTTNLILLPYFSLFFESFMVINDHSKTFQAQHLDFFWFFKKSMHHTIFFQKKSYKKNGNNTTIYLSKGRFLWYYFSLSYQSPHFISIFGFQCNILSIALIYHMVLKNLQKFFILNHFLLP